MEDAARFIIAVVKRLRLVMRLVACTVSVDGAVEEAIKVVKVVDGVDQCTVGFVHHVLMSLPAVKNHVNKFVQVSELYHDSDNTYKKDKSYKNYGMICMSSSLWSTLRLTSLALTMQKSTDYVSHKVRQLSRQLMTDPSLSLCRSTQILVMERPFYRTTPIYSLPMMRVINPTTDKCKVCVNRLVRASRAKTKLPRLHIQFRQHRVLIVPQLVERGLILVLSWVALTRIDICFRVVLTRIDIHAHVGAHTTRERSLARKARTSRLTHNILK
eukprot:scaffold3846_cov108-Amphora_coffeaeformis.AAC.10